MEFMNMWGMDDHQDKVMPDLPREALRITRKSTGMQKSLGV